MVIFNSYVKLPEGMSLICFLFVSLCPHWFPYGLDELLELLTSFRHAAGAHFATHSALTRVEASDIHLFPRLGFCKNGHLWAITTYPSHVYGWPYHVSRPRFPQKNAVKSVAKPQRRRGIHGRAASPSCWAAFLGDFSGAPEPRNCHSDGRWSYESYLSLKSID